MIRPCLIAMVISVAACSSEVEPSSPGGEGSGGSGGSSPTSVNSSASSSATSTSTASSSSGGEGPCSGSTCASHELCVDPTGYCGVPRGDGLNCVEKPSACSDGAPACGCDGNVYDSQCAANIAGIDVGPASTCPAPAGYFPCHNQFCAEGLVCFTKLPPDDQTSPVFGCASPPSACADAPSCQCLIGAAHDPPFYCSDKVVPTCTTNGTDVEFSCEP